MEVARVQVDVHARTPLNGFFTTGGYSVSNSTDRATNCLDNFEGHQSNNASGPIKDSEIDLPS